LGIARRGRGAALGRARGGRALAAVGDESERLGLGGEPRPGENGCGALRRRWAVPGCGSAPR